MHNNMNNTTHTTTNAWKNINVRIRKKTTSVFLREEWRKNEERDKKRSNNTTPMIMKYAYNIYIEHN